MPGLKIIEVVLGLVFVYLLMSLLCTAINEYVAGMLNKRGKELFRAVDALLEDDAVRTAFREHPLIATLSPSKRLPSYMPARNFALALLNSIDFLHGTSASPPGSPPAGDVVPTPPKLRRLLDALAQESPADVSELLRDPAVASILGSAAVPGEVRDAIVNVATGAEQELHKLQDAVEVWFNNAMDRVQGSYKRYTQIALLLIGFVVALLLNVDTIRIWQTLSTNDELRSALVQRAIAFHAAATTPVDTTKPAPAPGATNTTTPSGAPQTDTTSHDTTSHDSASAAARTAHADSLCTSVSGDTVQKAVAKVVAGERITCREARAVMLVAKAELDSTQLALGWSRAELLGIGVVREVPHGPSRSWGDALLHLFKKQAAVTPDSAPRDTTKHAAASPGHGEKDLAWQWPWNWSRAIWPKLLGLILTAIAVSLGAPFWFDMLNKIINIRAAGRAPDERPKDPEAKDKRLAGQAPR